MVFQNGLKFRSLLEFLEYLPQDQRIMTDVLRQIVLEILPAYCKEKFTYNVPFYYGKRRICLIWPAAVPWGGFSSGVMLGFCQGNKLNDTDGYLTHGRNKQIYYKIFQSIDEMDMNAIVSILKEAVETDGKFK